MKVKYQLAFLWLLTTLTDNSRSVENFSFTVPFFTMDLGNNNKSVEGQKMDNEYSTRLNFLERVAVDNLMKTRLDKVVVIQMESRQKERNQRKLKLGTWNESNRLYCLEEKNYSRILKIWENFFWFRRSRELWVIRKNPKRIGRLGPYDLQSCFLKSEYITFCKLL